MSIIQEIRDILAMGSGCQEKVRQIELLVGLTIAELPTTKVSYPNLSYSRDHGKIVTVLGDGVDIRVGLSGDCLVWDGEKVRSVNKSRLIPSAEQPEIFVGPKGEIFPGDAIEVDSTVVSNVDGYVVESTVNESYIPESRPVEAGIREPEAEDVEEVAPEPAPVEEEPNV